MVRRIFKVALAALLLSLPTLTHAQTVLKRSESVVHIDGTNYHIHNVGQGETVYALSRLYGVTEDDIRRENPTAREGLSVGQVLKIPVKHEEPANPRRQARLFDEHTVRAGETAYSIARNYGISLTTLVEDNPDLDPTLLSTGVTLRIRKKEVGGSTPTEVSQQWEDYRDAANQVSEDFVYHIVKPGETLYSLSRMFGVTQESFIEINQLDEGLKANAMIRIPVGAAMFPYNETQTVPEENEGDHALVFEPRPEGSQSFGPGNIPNIALLLPLEGTVAVSSDFVEFYRGALLAFEDLKAEGHSMNVSLYNSARSDSVVRDIVTSFGFSNTDLLIGPVYETEMSPAVQFAEAYNVPLVSPLAAVGGIDSDMLYQMAPDPSTKYQKLRELFSGGKNVILVSSGAADDREFEREIIAEIGSDNYGRFTIGGSGDVASLVDWDRENVFVILAGTEIAVDRALASISSSYNNASARRSRRADIRVVGSSRWAGFSSNSIDKSLYFKLNVCFVTSYYVDRSDSGVARFEARFLETYGDFPSRAAYRGYDAVKIFAGALFEPGYSFPSKLREVDMAPIQTPYRFVRKDGGRSFVNDQWVLVSFRNSYDIIVE